jgi:hypothetical protein
VSDCRFAYVASTFCCTIPQRDRRLVLILQDSIPAEWEFEEENYERMFSLPENVWRQVVACLPEWLDDVFKGWHCEDEDERGILWTYQRIKISLSTLVKGHRNLLETIKEFDRQCLMQKKSRLL